MLWRVLLCRYGDLHWEKKQQIHHGGILDLSLQTNCRKVATSRRILPPSITCLATSLGENPRWNPQENPQARPRLRSRCSYRSGSLAPKQSSHEGLVLEQLHLREGDDSKSRGLSPRSLWRWYLLLKLYFDANSVCARCHVVWSAMRHT